MSSVGHATCALQGSELCTDVVTHEVDGQAQVALLREDGPALVCI
jgi:hypothetical protein